MDNNNDNRTMDGKTLDETTLEEMKAQLGLLNGKLKEQEIINENHIRQSIRNRISEINRSAVVAVFAGVFVVLVGSAYFLTLGLPESFVVVTDIFVAICIAATMYMHRGLWRDGVFGSDVVSAIRKVRNFRKNYERWTIVGIVAALLWFAWMIYLCLSTGGEELQSFAIGGGTGLLVGLILGIRKNRQVIRRADEILKDLREINNLQKIE